MAQESWKTEKDETDCEILKPPASASSSSSSPKSSPPPPLFIKTPQEPPAQRSETADAPIPDSNLKAAFAETPKEEAPKPIRFTNRCSSCQKRVGLTGFRCRCGNLFCGRHRYSDIHDCSFDYKAAGRDQISKANPLIRAAKIIKI